MTRDAFDAGRERQTAPPPSPMFESGSEVEIAQAVFADLAAGSVVRPVYDGEMYVYREQSGLYEPVERAALRLMAHPYDGAPADKRPIKLSQSMIKGIAEIVCDLARSPGFFKAAPSGIACTNGFLLVSAGGAQLVAHSPDNRARWAMAIPYDPSALRERWQRFLDEVFEPDSDRLEKQAFLQQFVGAALVGKATMFEVCAVLTGVGQNGKSQAIDVFDELFPPGAVSHVAPQDFGNQYYRAKLVGKLWNSVSELPKAEMMESEAFKHLITGEGMSAREIREAVVFFRPVAGHCFAANELPGTRDQSVAFWRRLIPITFNRQFPPGKRELKLGKRMAHEELAGIFAWAVEGAVTALRNQNLTIPPSVAAAKEKWRQSADQALEFAQERLEAATDDVTTGADLYSAYERWAKANGHRSPLANKSLADRLEGLGFVRRRRKGRSYWLLSIRPELTAAEVAVEAGAVLRGEGNDNPSDGGAS